MSGVEELEDAPLSLTKAVSWLQVGQDVSGYLLHTAVLRLAARVAGSSPMDSSIDNGMGVVNSGALPTLAGAKSCCEQAEMGPESFYLKMLRVQDRIRRLNERHRVELPLESCCLQVEPPDFPAIINWRLWYSWERPRYSFDWSPSDELFLEVMHYVQSDRFVTDMFLLISDRSKSSAVDLEVDSFLLSESDIQSEVNGGEDVDLLDVDDDVEYRVGLDLLVILWEVPISDIPFIRSLELASKFDAAAKCAPSCSSYMPTHRHGLGR